MLQRADTQRRKEIQKESNRRKTKGWRQGKERFRFWGSGGGEGAAAFNRVPDEEDGELAQ